MLPVMVAAAIGAAKVVAIAVPEKAYVVGPRVSQGRRRFTRIVRKSIVSHLKAKKIDRDEAAEMISQIGILQRRAASGWSSGEELTALGRVVLFSVKTGMSDAFESFTEALKTPSSASATKAA